MTGEDRGPAATKDEVQEVAAMITVFVTFEYNEGFDRNRILAVAEKAKGAFVGMPGLRSKAFTIDAENRRARNVYLWESEEAARAFFTPELTKRVTGLYGVAPRIEFAEVAALVDNGSARAP
jgi:heme-degrading monooxygenase HmoA